ncbi:glycosyl hydrolase 108 family protein [Leclercia sp.]|uniref:glycoside hydrolase family 108 protein n=1 Tax=Leclercia sp. TaxID=1898428 RepID=UPI0028B03AB7|nr:glycosyl hydrolase 108 family protein [Leclercia sp.]
MTLDQIIDATIKAEGGYVNDPADSGGATNYGITEKVARANGYTGDMRSLPLATAKQIYRNEYLVKPGFADFPSEIAAELFDTGVNMGPATAAKFLQRAINALQGSSLTVDGKMGPATKSAVNAYLASRVNSASILLKALNCLQGVRYIEIVEKNPSQRKFVNGWISQRISL